MKPSAFGFVSLFGTRPVTGSCVFSANLGFAGNTPRKDGQDARAFRKACCVGMRKPVAGCHESALMFSANLGFAGNTPRKDGQDARAFRKASSQTRSPRGRHVTR